MLKLFYCFIIFICAQYNALALPMYNNGVTVLPQTLYSNTDTPLYIRNKVMPYFAMRLIDSSMTYRSKFPKKLPVLLVYFNPDCDHCKDDFKKLFIVFISTASLPSIKTFAETYGIQGKNIIIGRDEAYKLPVYFNIRFAPFVVLYNKDKNIENVYEGGITWQKLKEVLAKL
jgi:thiol-disulfide isomerase/thioredoxin